MIYIIDSYAWIENLQGTSKGEKLEKMFENIKDKFVTMECTLSEVYGFCLRVGANFEDIHKIIKLLI